jgi:nucleotide-binding universal stress UspA family protein
MNSGPVLAATDLTARSDRAIDRAFLLSDQLSRPVHVVHAIESDSESNTAEIERKLRESLPEGSREVRVFLPQGNVPEAIGKVAEECGAALICVGPARFNSLKDFFLGTAVDYIAREVERPLLVVKQRPRKSYSSIIFATDFSDNSRRALQKAASLFPDARFHLLHAFHVPYAAWNRDEYVKEELQSEEQGAMDDFIASLVDVAGLDDRVDGRVARGNLFEGIYEAAEEFGANLVAFGTHGESGFRHATIGSVANELLTNLTLDSLIIQP